MTSTNVFFGNTASDRQENATVNDYTGDQELTVDSLGNSSVANGNMVSVKTLERCFNEKIDRKMGNMVETVEDRIQNAILIAIDRIFAPKIKLAIRSINESTGPEAKNVTVISKRGELRGYCRKEYTTCVQHEWWDSKWYPGRTR